MIKQNELKKCSSCKIDKILSIDFFSRCIGNLDGFSYWCKECHSEYLKNRIVSEEEKERNRERSRIWYHENQDIANKRNRLKYLINPEEYKRNARIWRLKNSNRKKMIDREWQKNNPEKTRQYSIGWKKANPEKYKLITKKAHIKRMSTSKGRLDHAMSSAINIALNGAKNGHCWELLVGYTLNDLMKHLEKQFQIGMTWKNYGNWHVDHKIPVSVFNYSKPEDIDFKRCWALKNLQPLWAGDNIRKSNKLKKAFQPCLSFSSVKGENCVQS